MPHKVAFQKKCRGLYTAPNVYDVPEGALVKATNILIRRDGVIEPKWGMTTSGVSIADANVSDWHRVIEYKDKLFWAGRRTDGASYEIAMSDIASFAGVTAQATGENPPDQSSNFNSSTRLPFFDLEFIKTNNNLYYNTFDGLKRIPDTTGSNIRKAGPPRTAIAIMPRLIRTSLSRSGTTTVTATTPFNHLYAPGITVVMSSAGNANFGAGTYTIVSVPSATTFTYVDATATTTATLANQTFAAAQFVGASGILTTNEQVAYRAALVEYDPNGFEYRGEVSARVEITDASPFVGNGANKNVQVAVLFGASVPAANSKVQLYRTKKGTVTPGDEMYKVYERFITSDERTRGVMWITDSTPDTVTGEALYTNEAQEGSARNNLRPKGAKTVGLWQNKIALANTFDYPSIELQLLGTSGLPATINIDSANTTNVFTPTASGTDFTGHRQFTYYTGGTASTDTKNTVLSFVDCINWGASSGPLNTFFAQFTSVAGDWPGRFAIRRVAVDQYDVTSNTATTRTIAGTDLYATRQVFAPTLGARISGFATVDSVSRAANVVTITLTIGSVGAFTVGEEISLYTDYSAQTAYTIGGTAVTGVITAINTGAGTITLSNTGSNGGGAAGSDFTIVPKYMPTYNASRKLNEVCVSKTGQPEAFPAFSTILVGQPGQNILKVVQCGQSLLVFKEDGLFRVLEDGDGILRAEMLDPTAILWAKDTAVPINDRVMAWLTKGVAIINEQGVEKYVSDRISDKFKPDQLQNTFPFSKRAVAYVDEVYGLYELRICFTQVPAVPYASTTNLVYNIFNDTWVEDDVSVTSETFYKGLRYLQSGSSYNVQQAYPTSIFTGQGTSSTMNTVAASSTARIFTATKTGGTIVKGALLVGNSNNTQLYVTNISGNALTLYAPDSSVTASDISSEPDFATYLPIVADIKFPPITFVDENKLKLFKEIQLLFGTAEHFVTELYTSTELVSTQEAITAFYTSYGTSTNGSGILASDPGNLRVFVPQQHKRAQQLNLEIIIRTVINGAFGAWTLLGIGIAADVTGSTRVSR